MSWKKEADITKKNLWTRAHDHVTEIQVRLRDTKGEWYNATQDTSTNARFGDQNPMKTKNLSYVEHFRIHWYKYKSTVWLGVWFQPLFRYLKRKSLLYLHRKKTKLKKTLPNGESNISTVRFSRPQSNKIKHVIRALQCDIAVISIRD